MAETIVIVKKPKNGAKKSKGHKGKQQSHNRDTGKYMKQAVRTARNKERNILKAKKLKAEADERKLKGGKKK